MAKQTLFLSKTISGSRPDPKLAPKTNLICPACCVHRRLDLAPPAWWMESYPDEVYHRLMTRTEKKKFWHRPGDFIEIDERVHSYFRYSLLGQGQFFRIVERLCSDCVDLVGESFSDESESSIYYEDYSHSSSSSNDDDSAMVLESSQDEQ